MSAPLVVFLAGVALASAGISGLSGSNWFAGVAAGIGVAMVVSGLCGASEGK